MQWKIPCNDYFWSFNDGPCSIQWCEWISSLLNKYFQNRWYDRRRKVSLNRNIDHGTYFASIFLFRFIHSWQIFKKRTFHIREFRYGGLSDFLYIFSLHQNSSNALDFYICILDDLNFNARAFVFPLLFWNFDSKSTFFCTCLKYFCFDHCELFNSISDDLECS